MYINPFGGQMMALERKKNAPNLEARELLSEKIFTVRDAGISYRVLNHWSEIGLIEDTREYEAGWRKLSVADLLWIRIIQELRKFGLPLEKLAVVRSSLFGDEWSGSVIEDAIDACMSYMPMCIFVYETGMAEIECPLGLDDLDTGYGYLNYIRINLNLLWYELSGDAADPYFDRIKEAQSGDISAQEEAEGYVLGLMRSDEAHEININRHPAKSTIQIDVTKRIEGVQRVSEMYKDLSFGELHINLEGGKPVATKITKKKRIKK
jgi:hypothetical protein